MKHPSLPRLSSQPTTYVENFVDDASSSYQKLTYKLDRKYMQNDLLAFQPAIVTWFFFKWQPPTFYNCLLNHVVKNAAAELWLKHSYWDDNRVLKHQISMQILFYWLILCFLLILAWYGFKYTYRHAAEIGQWIRFGIQFICEKSVSDNATQVPSENSRTNSDAGFSTIFTIASTRDLRSHASTRPTSPVENNLSQLQISKMSYHETLLNTLVWSEHAKEFLHFVWIYITLTVRYVISFALVTFSMDHARWFKPSVPIREMALRSRSRTLSAVFSVPPHVVWSRMR